VNHIHKHYHPHPSAVAPLVPARHTLHRLSIHSSTPSEHHRSFPALVSHARALAATSSVNLWEPLTSRVVAKHLRWWPTSASSWALRSTNTPSSRPVLGLVAIVEKRHAVSFLHVLSTSPSSYFLQALTPAPTHQHKITNKLLRNYFSIRRTDNSKKKGSPHG
jgi:hypothetical protein